MRVLFAATDWEKWEAPLRAACPEADFVLDSAGEPVDAIIYAPGGPALDFRDYPGARLVQSLWAGVEKIAPDPHLTQPLARMVDPGLADGMAEYCAGWALRFHLGMDAQAQDGIWRAALPPLASERRVTIAGMGALGGRVAQTLAGLGFDVCGWSASGRGPEGMRVYAGPDLEPALSRADILVTLLPDTAETRGLLNAKRLAMLPRGAAIINPGRGTLIDDEALLAALDEGRVSRAALDVFHTEPLPPNHPFWHHERIHVTPHIAAATRPETAALLVAENLRRAASGREPLYLVDRARGY